MIKKVFPPINEEMARIAKEEPHIVVLSLYNGKDITLEMSDIVELELTNVHIDHHFNAPNFYIEKHKACNKVYLKLFAKADREYIDNIKTTVFLRLEAVKDICSITYLNQLGEFLERIYVPWKTRNSDIYENEYQVVNDINSGGLEVIIKGE